MNDFILNEDMTEAVLENCKMEIDFKKKIFSDCDSFASAIFGLSNTEKLRGTVANQETISKLKQANEALDIIGIMDDIELEKFSEPNPKCREGIVSVTINEGIGFFKGSVYRAFRRVVDLADEVTIMPRSNDCTRIVFIFKDLWSEFKELTDEEIKNESIFWRD